MIYPLITKSGELSVREMCQLAQVSRSSFYRYLVGETEPDGFEMALRDEIQGICLAFSGYGYRRVTKELKRRGYRVNHKRVLKLMRQDNLLCVRKKRFVRTTDSEHGLPVYPNLARELHPDAVNQLWRSDITYIRFLREFVYLAVILDAYSRRVIGWALSRHIDTNLTLSALNMALKARTVVPGLIHHSDQGVQYAARAYLELLQTHGITISMSRSGNPYDNAMAESFMKTLKYEEVLLNEYETLEDALDDISYFIEEVYNNKRLHSSLGYRPPVEFEEMTAEKPQVRLSLNKQEIVSV